MRALAVLSLFFLILSPGWAGEALTFPEQGAGCFNADMFVLHADIPHPVKQPLVEVKATVQVPSLRNGVDHAKVVFHLEKHSNLTDEWVVLDDSWSVQLDTHKTTEFVWTYHLHDTLKVQPTDHLRMAAFTEFHNSSVCVLMEILPMSYIGEYQAIFGAVLLFAVFLVIALELIHRTLAAMIGAFLGFFLLLIFRHAPSMATMFGWIEEGTIGLLLAMMCIVGIFSRTGFFELCAYRALLLCGRHRWLLLFLLCGLSGFTSAFLDNVTTIMLLGPVTVEIARMMHVPATPMLLSITFFSTIGGTATLIGDPPNLIIGNQLELKFLDFVVNLAPCVILCAPFAMLYLRAVFRKQFSGENVRALENAAKDAEEAEAGEAEAEGEGAREDHLLVAPGASSYGAVEEGRGARREVELVTDPVHSGASAEGLAETRGSVPGPGAGKPDASPSNRSGAPGVTAAEEENAGLVTGGAYRITSVSLFIKTLVVLICLILGFFLESLIGLSTTWMALLACVILILITSPHHVDEVLEKVEWSTLIFFACLFILVQMLSQLGLLRVVGASISSVIAQLPEKARFPVALLVILWVSGIFSAFIDNIPYTASMIPVITQIAGNRTLNLPLHPLVWALALGACLGGNGTLIGASANVIVAGIAERTGQKITFLKFLRIGFPLMTITLSVASVYCLCVYAWWGLY